jgi:G3E family GTPase
MPKMFLFWKPKAPIPAAERVPVTLLSGFLGSGKTTLLNHLLSSGAEEELAVLVNDLGEVNIDASLIKRSVRTMKQPISGMVELTSGCICCSIQTELMDALLHLYRKRKPSHILIEATGVAEPKSILETLYAANLEGVRGVDFLRVANLVTVVDAANLEDHLGTRAEAGQRRRNHLLPADQRRPLEELLMEQIECADLLLLNKTDQIEPDHVDRLEGYLRSLNERAVIRRCSFGQIDAAELLGTERFDEEATMASARWRTLILSNEGRVTEAPRESAAPTPGFSSLTPVPLGSSATGRGGVLACKRKPQKRATITRTTVSTALSTTAVALLMKRSCSSCSVPICPVSFEPKAFTGRSACRKKSACCQSRARSYGLTTSATGGPR